MKSRFTDPDPSIRSLAIGLPPAGGYKETLVTYTGLPKVKVPTLAEGVRQGVRVFLWNKEDPLTATRNSERIVVITDHSFLAKALGLETSPMQSYYFHIDHGPLRSRSFYINAPGNVIKEQESKWGTCYHRENKPIGNSGIIVEETGNILFLSVPWDILDIHMGEHWEYRPFYSPFVGRHFVETGPSLDFGALRRLFLELILYAFRSLDLPLVRQRHPLSGQATFCFKIDGDGFSKESTESALRISREVGNQPFSWFIDVQGWGDNLPYVGRLIEKGQEVELHCYHHMTYQSRRVNLSNHRMGIRRLTKYSGRLSGVAAPYGFWFPGYQQAIKELGFNFSSEFGFNIDDFPCFPYNDSSYPLQVPQHTASIGALERNGFSREEILIHLKGALEEAVKDRGWAIIYDHPLHRLERYEQEFITLFKTLLDSGFRYMSLTEYVRLARGYLLYEFHPFLMNGQLHIEEDEPGSGSFEIYSTLDNSLPTGTYNVVPGSLSPISDEFTYPPSHIFDTIEAAKGKYASLTTLSPAQWYYTLAKIRIKRILKDIKGYQKGGS